jgi:Cdc6-like AAA superfamily ATPase
MNTHVNSKHDNLPTAPQIFVGRQREVAKIERALADLDRNVVIISGMGGIGKTSLARFVANQQRDTNRFPGGVVWIDCTIDDSLPSILMTIAHDVGIESPSLTSGALRHVVLSHLRTNPTLLVLNNYEAVAENDEVLSFVGRLP